jgi:hypothetical protein
LVENSQIAAFDSSEKRRIRALFSSIFKAISKHTVRIGGFGWIWYLLKYIPMLYPFPIGIESININASYTPVIRIIIVQIDKIYMRLHPIATCNNTMYHYTQILPCSSNTVKELAQGFSCGGNYGIMLDVVRHQVLFNSLYSPFFVDH